MAYACGTLDVLNRAGRTRTWSDADRKSADAMMGYKFARNGNPNAEGLPVWPAYKPDSEQMMVFGQEMKTDDLSNKKQLHFFKEP
jgi:para-nitrobenzyl esterase